MPFFKKHDKERRRHARLKAYCLVRYSKANHPPALVNAKNISGGGILITTPERVPLDTVLTVAINLPSKNKVIETHAKVSRCSRISLSRRGYYVGLNFMNLPADVQAEITAHVEDLHKRVSSKKDAKSAPWWPL